MADVEFKAKMEKMEAAKTIDDKVVVLQQIADMFKRGNTPPLLACVKNSNLMKVLAEILVANKAKWLNVTHNWILTMAHSIYIYMKFDIPQEHTKTLIEVAIDYLNATENEFPPSLLYAIAGRIDTAITNHLFENMPLHERMKKLAVMDAPCASKAVCFFSQVCAYDNWKMRLLEDRQFLLDLIIKPVPDTWVLFFQLSKHTDAKNFMPQEVIQKASTVDDDWCPAICAALSNESNAAGLKLNMKYIETIAKQLEELMNNKDTKVFSRYTLFGIQYPLANLSVGDANKEPLGKIFIPLLKRSLQIPKNSLNPNINNLKYTEARQLGAKCLWNLAFNETNRERIAEGGGLEALKQILNSSEADDILKKNIEGILYMFNAPKEVKPVTTVANADKHIMISYNWDNQPTILRLAESLKKHGFKIWLDVEQMKGSTLGAMADAIEGAAVVLICMSQRYKDSPNCRLEGEYCINRKVPFIPLMLQNNYKPEGWLGILLGTKLWFPFFSDDGWDGKAATLAKAIEMELAASGATAKAIANTQESPQAPGVETWTKTDILEWMKAEEIDQFYELFMQHKLYGKALRQLKRQQNLVPLLRQMLDITTFGDLLLIEAAIQKL